MAQTSRIEIFSAQGKKLCELEAPTVRSWVLNRLGTCEIAIPMSNRNFTATNMKDGNLIVVHGTDVPDWGGVLTDFDKWTRDGFCVKTCYTAEWMLSYRIAYVGYQFGENYASAPFQFRQLISLSSVPGALPLSLGSVYEDGRIVGAAGNKGMNFYDILVSLMNLTPLRYNIVLSQSNSGSPSFIANLYNPQGNLVSGQLEEGFNVVLPPGVVLQRQANIANKVYGFIQGSNGVYQKIDGDSQSFYGVREAAITVQSGVNPQPYVDGAVAQRKFPQNDWTLNVINKSHIFKSLVPGNTLPLITHTLPFNPDGTKGGTRNVQITSMSYSDTKPELILTVQEVN